MFCGYCGNQIEGDVSFCPFCGSPKPDARMTIAEQPALEQEPVQQDAFAQEQPAWQPPMQEQPAWQPPVQEQPAWQPPVQEQPAWQPPVQQQYWPVQQPVPVPVREPRQPKPPKPIRTKPVYPKASVGVRILSVVLCVLIFLFGFVAALQSSVRGALGRENLEKIIDSYDAKQITMRDSNGNEVPLMLYIQELAGVDFQKDYNVDISRVADFANSGTFRALLKDWVLRYTAYYRDGTALYPLTGLDVKNQLLQIASEIKIYTGYNITGGRVYDESTGKYIITPNNAEEADALLAELEVTPGRGLDKLAIDKLVGFDTSWVSFGLSLLMTIGLALLAVILMALLALCNRKIPYRFFHCGGITLTVLGGFLVLLGGGGMIALAITKLGLAQLFANPLLLRLLIIGLILLAVGLLMLFVGRRVCNAVWNRNHPETPAAEA